MGVFALLQMLSHVTGTALSGMRAMLTASRHAVSGFPLAPVCINIRSVRSLPQLSQVSQLHHLHYTHTFPCRRSKLCLQALRTGCAFRAINAINGGILSHERASKQGINVLHRWGLFRAHTCFVVTSGRGLLWTFYKMWLDNGCSLKGNDFQRTMQQLEALMMGDGLDALMTTG
jgi:hypothetical protein